jgi:PPP family 3-phenylpropionic acid transporter
MILLATYWFFLIGALGLFFPYYSLYLSENAGLTGSEVGLVMATLPLVGILFQPLWGQVADRTGSRETVLTLVSAGAAAGYAGLYFAGSFVSWGAGPALLAVFSTATIPMCVSVCFDLLPDRGPHAFGLTRTWGTVGFLVAVVVFPYALDRWQAWRGLDAVAGGPSEPGLEIMLPATACLLLCAMVVSLFIPRKRSHAVRAGRGDWRELLGHGPFVRVLVFIFASYVCLQGPIVLFPIFVRSLGGSVAMVSHMWIFMLLLEIPLIALSGAGFTRLGGRGLLAIGSLPARCAGSSPPSPPTCTWSTPCRCCTA